MSKLFSLEGYNPTKNKVMPTVTGSLQEIKTALGTALKSAEYTMLLVFNGNKPVKQYIHQQLSKKVPRKWVQVSL